MKKINLNQLLLVFFICGTIVACKSKKKVADVSNPDDQVITETKIPEDDTREWPEDRDMANETKTEMKAEDKLTDYFSAIANAPTTTSANRSINEALTMFASPDTPVLIVISESGGMKDYDRPTTIREYLNYLKDQKKNINAISSIQTDGSGKITELELKK